MAHWSATRYPSLISGSIRNTPGRCRPLCNRAKALSAVCANISKSHSPVANVGIILYLSSMNFQRYAGLIATAIILILLCAGCSCNYHLEKARQKCGTTHFTDTIRVHDTTFITQDFHDTTFFYQTHDTVIMKDGRLVVKYFYHDSTVYLQGKCIADTIVKEVRVPCETTTLNFSWSEWLKKSLFWIIAILVVGLAVWKLRP